MGNSNENLQKVSAGESQAIRRYLFFADKADESKHRRH
jgi:rubrerythrin